MERKQPRVSRETRLLLGIVFVALASLWVLARMRFPDQPRNPNPVPPLLAQFSAPSPFEAMSSAVNDVETKIRPALARVTFTPRVADPAARSVVRLAVRVDGQHAVAVLPPGETPLAAVPPLTALDSRRGVGVVGAASLVAVPSAAWSPSRPPNPGFVIAAEATRDGTSFGPVFVGAFVAAENPRWPGTVWRLPGSAQVGDGALVFTETGLFAGAVVVRGGERTLVPAQVLSDVSRMLVAKGPLRGRGVIGVLVQEVTPLVAAAVGVDHGLVVSWVDPEGPAADLLRPLDVIDAVWGQPISSREQWDAQVDRLEPASTLDVRVRRAGEEPMAVTLTAVAAPSRDGAAPLGAAFRPRRGVGVEVTRIDPGGAAEHAGLRTGDLIVAAGPLRAPTTGQLAQLYASADGNHPVPLAVTRGSTHLVLALEPWW